MTQCAQGYFHQHSTLVSRGSGVLTDDINRQRIKYCVIYIYITNTDRKVADYLTTLCQVQQQNHNMADREGNSIEQSPS
jgi:hypothetical protein